MPDFSEKGWLADIALRYELKRGKTCLTEKRHLGPLMVQRPFYPEQGVAHTYLLHPPGGVVGGDTLSININVQPYAHALLTTPGATKFYRSAGGTASQTQTLTVAQEGFLEWLPQENIFFPDAQVCLTTHIHLASSAKFIGWEMQCFGRPVLNEWFETGKVKGRLNFYVDERLILTESMRVEGLQKQAAAMREFPMFGSLYIYPATDALKEIIQHHLEKINPLVEYGLTDVDGILVLRVLGTQTEPVMACFAQVWQIVRQHWLGYCPEPPRIWAT
ncbi:MULTISPECIES: urease accessory protein UreD [Proteus]|uniref:urease accessory protein UreD n=1 Tax=Proteus TaxID=583 RepID=UPI00117B032C|nr:MULTISPECIES: urease accessory protein UreD [Proteus]EHT2445827.1 urease accessory protein UreD [Proteus mirabilis]EKU0760904.1 urease accessory protein UreD [Proteus mirabilis]EKX9204949.1 urease accessory protein UreD [Proteus mirabilis]ELA7861380.1 urease accessory protein UreD [Proteus mirabilis]ELB1204785.1 urease accessory protein UreD [Proteus mirabilis]